MKVDRLIAAQGSPIMLRRQWLRRRRGTRRGGKGAGAEEEGVAAERQRQKAKGTKSKGKGVGWGLFDFAFCPLLILRDIPPTTPKR
jgi:hypothetical protein